ncbi:MAG: hypothetical protein Q8R30_03285 [bacterium]|nr:hypothetical protein [bacterium]
MNKITQKITKGFFFAALMLVALYVWPHTADAALIIKGPNYLGLNAGLVGFWSFDGGDIVGSPGGVRTVYDLSGGGNTGNYWNATGHLTGDRKDRAGIEF